MIVEEPRQEVMLGTTARLLLAATISVCAVQLGCTVLDRNAWPLCSYNMFNRVPIVPTPYLGVVLIENDGTRTEVLPGATIPVEFFRASDVLLEAYQGRDRSKQAAFSGTVLDRLNVQPWGAFDETMAAATPRSGSAFIGLELHARWLDVTQPVVRPAAAKHSEAMYWWTYAEASP